MQELSNNDFQIIKKFAKENLGIFFTDQKKVLIFSRLRHRLNELHFENCSDYVNFIKNDLTGNELIIFENSITTNHTYFMREEDHFRFVMNEVFPQIEKNSSSKKDLRLWCAGCSSGEEAYMLAIFAHIYFKNKSNWNTEILATDISSSAITSAIRGIYPIKSCDKINKNIISSYFKKFDEDNLIINKNIRNIVTFRKTILLMIITILKKIANYFL